MPENTNPGDLWFLGDLHGHFDDEDERYISEVDPALTIFVGDLGDENPRIVRRIVDLPFETRCILGNHDAWLSFRKKEATPALRESLDVLGDKHLAYSTLDMDAAGVGIVGCRPFSWGGPSLRSPELYEALYGVTDHESSAAKIIEAAEASKHRNIVLVAHNGPYGLGKRPSDIFGKDFGRPGGDWGDRDLQLAIRGLVDRGFRIPLVLAGHMHHQLMHPKGEFRKRCKITPETVYANIARVPRIFKSSDGETIRHYARATIVDGRLRSLVELYVQPGKTRRVDLFGPIETENASEEAAT